MGGGPRPRSGDVSGVCVRGIGVHSGAAVTVRLHRSEGPLAFRLGATIVAADVDRVVATPRCTVLGDDGATVAMVEHLLAALAVAGFWSGVVIEVDGPELPILDGSAAPWREAVAELGVPPPPPEALRVAHDVRFEHEGTTIELRTGAPSLDVRVAFDAPIGPQAWSGPPERFDELLDARTFAFRHELEALWARGLALGAAPGRGIVFTADGPEAPLRSADEPVRHKALDAVGDLVLLGRPLAAAVRIDRGSHAAHVIFMRHLRTLPFMSADERSPSSVSRSRA
jgi:UDP-3-O-[3-hydroxymyristoyl] N-acetylglucosamine deacetylase